MQPAYIRKSCRAAACMVQIQVVILWDLASRSSGSHWNG